jgi:hypothetical protein
LKPALGLADRTRARRAILAKRTKLDHADGRCMVARFGRTNPPERGMPFWQIEPRRDHADGRCTIAPFGKMNPSMPTSGLVWRNEPNRDAPLWQNEPETLVRVTISKVVYAQSSSQDSSLTNCDIE